VSNSSDQIDVVIPVHGHYQLTDRCLSRLASQTEPHRVIVVDDASPDDSAQRLARAWPEVTVVTLEANRGFSAAVNAGVAAGTGDHVVVLNNDVQIVDEAVARLVAPLRTDPGLGSVAATILRADDHLIDSAGIAIDGTLAGFPRLRGEPASASARSRPRLAGPDGNAGAFRRAAWEQAHGFDEHLPAYLEVVDLALRFALLGWRTTLVPEVLGSHAVSASYGQRSAAARFNAGVSRGYMLRHWRVLGRRVAARTLATEMIVLVADALLCRDVAASRGRIRGWHAAGRVPVQAEWPASAIDPEIGFRESMRLRRRGAGPVRS
jgi:N-acetylglucosaminyl-diphospho-decaprenol L-rhamnosyltransferase